MEMNNGCEKSVVEQMSELKEKDPSFAQKVNFIETKIDAQIQTYNNTKTLKENYPNCAVINFTMPIFAMTPLQRLCLKEYFKDKYLKETSGEQIRIEKCFFGRKYRVTSKMSFFDVLLYNMEKDDDFDGEFDE